LKNKIDELDVIIYIIIIMIIKKKIKKWYW